MKLGIDVSRALKDQKTGIELYSKYVIEGILENFTNEIILYSPTNLKGTYLGKYLKKKNVQERVIKGRKFWTLWHFSFDLLKKKPDILFIPSHTFPFFIPEKSIITIHDIAFKIHPEVYSPIQRFYLNWSTKRAVKKAAKIIVPSISTKNDLEKYFNCDHEKIVVIPHGIPQDIVYKHTQDEVKEYMKFFRLKKDQKFFLYIGRIELKKNLINLIKAFEIFSKKFPEYKLLICGKRGYGFKKIFKEISDRNLWRKIFAPGFIEDKEKDFLLKKCTAFLYPTLYEGFGYPILECFQSNTPILVSSNSSIKEVAHEGAIYTDPNDLLDIAKKMEKLTNPDKDIQKKAQEQLKKFSWEKCIKKHLDVLRELV